ncbi:hypothetical protein [Herbaspirillum rubrisubalbicans]|nr:hypothetical protein [Herbaspirillum rubrisubalbicans]
MRIALKFLVLLWMCCALNACSRESVVLQEKELEKIRESYDLRTDDHPQYAFVYADGSKCCTAPPQQPVYLLNLMLYGPLELVFSEEINALFKKKFVLQIDNSSLIESGDKHFFVMTISAPADQRDAAPRCITGKPEQKAYLLAVSGGKVDIVHENMLGCDTAYEPLLLGRPLGYEVSHVGEPVEFLRLRDGNVIHQIKPVE